MRIISCGDKSESLTATSPFTVSSKTKFKLPLEAIAVKTCLISAPVTSIEFAFAILPIFKTAHKIITYINLTFTSISSLKTIKRAVYRHSLCCLQYYAIFIYFSNYHIIYFIACFYSHIFPIYFQ